MVQIKTVKFMELLLGNINSCHAEAALWELTYDRLLRNVLERTQVQLDHTQTSPTTAPSAKVAMPTIDRPSRSRNLIPTNIPPEIATQVESQGGPQGELKVEMESLVKTEYEGKKSWLSPELEARNNDEQDSLPETDADRQFRQVLASVKANSFELHSIKARRLYKAVIAEEDMNNPIALKIRVSIVNAVNRSIKGSLWRFIQNPTGYDFHQHSDSWFQLSDDIENILTDDEYEFFFNTVAERMGIRVTEKGYIFSLRGPRAGTIPQALINSATVSGVLEWYVKHDLITLISSKVFQTRLEGRKKLLVHIRPSAAGRLAIYRGVQILWCLWKFTSNQEEMFTLLLACIPPIFIPMPESYRDIGVIMLMLSQFSVFRNFAFEFLYDTFSPLFNRKLGIAIFLLFVFAITVFIFFILCLPVLFFTILFQLIGWVGGIVIFIIISIL